jgi:DNA repair protein RadA/Sms
MVDTVIAFEGERAHPFRILRATKNRFGATDEIGVFEMGELGLAEVANPSALFLAERQGEVAGSAVFAGMEGTRPILVEIQALVAGQPPGTPRRAVVGWDSGRLAMVLAVLETRCGLSLAGRDVYLNVAGGLRIAEPAADLAVAAALVSAASGRPVPAGTVVFGEIGLSGEVRAVSRPELRLKEAQKLGFASALVPPARNGGRSGAQRSAGPRLVEIASVGDLVSHLAAAGVRAGAPRPLAVERS